VSKCQKGIRSENQYHFSFSAHPLHKTQKCCPTFFKVGIILRIQIKNLISICHALCQVFRPDPLIPSEVFPIMVRSSVESILVVGDIIIESFLLSFCGGLLAVSELHPVRANKRIIIIKFIHNLFFKLK